MGKTAFLWYLYLVVCFFFSLNLTKHKKELKNLDGYFNIFFHLNLWINIMYRSKWYFFKWAHNQMEQKCQNLHKFNQDLDDFVLGCVQWVWREEWFGLLNDWRRILVWRLILYQPGSQNWPISKIWVRKFRFDDKKFNFQLKFWVLNEIFSKKNFKTFAHPQYLDKSLHQLILHIIFPYKISYTYYEFKQIY